MKRTKKLALAMVIVAASLLTACKSEETRSVESLIRDIGEVTENSGEQIENAREAYNALSAEEQGKISNYIVLDEAEKTYDRIWIGKTENLINAIGDVDSDSAEKIAAARKSYDNLTKRQQENVGNFETLLNAETAYENLVLQEAKNAILALEKNEAEDYSDIERAEKAYAALNPEQRQKIEKEFGSFSELIETAKVRLVGKLIAGVRYTKAVEPDKLQLKQMIAATEAYLDLNETSREELDNINTLEKALKAYKKYIENRRKTDKLYARTCYLEECSPLDYETLTSYPDSFRGNKISVELEITAVKKGIMGESIYAVTTTDRQPLVLTDKRPVKEPRLTEGKTLTVYGEYKKMKTVTVKEEGTGVFGTGFWEKTKEEYEAPVIDFVYTDQDNLGVIVMGDPNAVDVSLDQEAENMKTELNELAKRFLEE